MYTPLKLFIRTLKRKKLFSFINVIGLSLGFLCATLIYLYVENEMNYDQFHENGESIYRINQTFIWGEDNTNLFSSTGPGVAHAILEEIPEVDQVVRVHTPSLLPITLNTGGDEKLFNEENILAADSNFFQVFSYPMLYGDRNTALKKMNAVVLTEKVSKRFFGDSNPLGNLIELGEGPLKTTYEVTGVLADQSENTYIEFDMMVSMSSIERVKNSNWSWMWTMFETYVVINENSNAVILQEKLNQLPQKYATETLEVMGYTYDEYIAAGKEWKLYLQPFQAIHLHSANIYNRLNSTGNFKVVAALIGSAFFIILLSCINFINLSTSQFTSKAKNASLRKVLGSSKAALRQIYFGEALLFCIISAVLSIGLTYYMLPIFNDMVGLELSFSLLDEPFYLLIIVGLILGVSSMAGLYPALFFSAFKPIEAMKGEMKSGKSGVRLRNGMMVLQYTLSLLLIICSVTVYQQLRYVFNSDMGFKKENLITVDNAYWANIYWDNSPDAFVNELSKVDGVVGASLCDATPLMVSNGDNFHPDKPDAAGVPLNYVLADENYIDLLELNVAVGRSFEKSYSDDMNGVILNESAVRSIGWELNESILNKKISNWSGEYHVVGVIKDFNYWSLQAPIEPFAIFHAKSNAQNGRPLSRVALSISADNPEDFNRIIGDLESKWGEFAHNRPFEYTILDQVFESAYESEAQFSKVITSFAALTIIIATLGLLGMVIFSIEQKLKEIGIRKVLGATSTSIASLFTMSYVKLLLFALIIASPIGYFLMENWLSDFEYRIHISPMAFLFSGGILLIVSMSISIYHSIKASNMNPSDVLKDE
jgi:putative ABC transport system permease protein